LSGCWKVIPMMSLGQRRQMSLALKDTQRPNKSPEPTAVGASGSAIAVHAASRRWLSFFR
jgi:hypothetical protein